MLNFQKQISEVSQQLAAKSQEQKSTANELEEYRMQADKKIGELLSKVSNIKMENHQIYIGRKSDRTDMVLAEYLNKYPEKEKMKILFLRETEGVYQFGQRRVYLKIDKANNIQVRVGGGFMHIDQFINQFTEIEQQRHVRRDAISRF